MKRIALIIGMSAIMFAVVVSCKKDNNDPPVQNSLAKDIAEAEAGTDGKYIYILNEGVWGGNDASLDRIEVASGEYQSDVFAKQNGRGLGDVANDILIYGSKMYIVVNNSNIVEVLDPETARSVRQIQLAGKQPRYIVGHEGYVYVSCYSDEVLKIDTATFSVVGSCAVGRDPEMLAVAGSNLYVVNSGGLDNPNYDTTLSVVDLSTFAETRKVAVGINPTKLAKIDDNRLLMVCNGNYGSIPSSMAVFRLSDDTVIRIPHKCTNFVINCGFAYCYDYDYANSTPIFFSVNLGDYRAEGSHISVSQKIEIPYGIALNPGNGNVYLTDSHGFVSNGDIHCYRNGHLAYMHECGSGPSKVAVW